MIIRTLQPTNPQYSGKKKAYDKGKKTEKV